MEILGFWDLKLLFTSFLAFWTHSFFGYVSFLVWAVKLGFSSDLSILMDKA
jgi:hypothetical protein